MSKTPKASPPRARRKAPSRWSNPPRVPGFAALEWNILTGTVWYSDEWRAMTMSEYDSTLPNNQEWWVERLPPADMAKLYRACLAIHAGLIDENAVVFRLLRGDGEWRTMYTKSRVTRKTGDGAPAVACGICVDITDEFGNGLDLRDSGGISEIDYQSMLENSPDLFVRFDRNLKPVYVNPAVNAYLGGLYNTPDNERRLTGDYKALFLESVERVFAEKAVVRKELVFAMSDGGEITGEGSFWPEFDDDGAVRFAMVQIRDMTEKRRMEQQLMLNERRFKALYQLTLMESAPEEMVLQFVMESMLELFKSGSGFIFIPEEADSDKGILLWSGDHYHLFDEGYLPGDHLPEDLIVQMTDSEGRRRYRSLNNNKGEEPLFVVFGGQMRVIRGIIAPVMEDNHMVCVAGVCNKDSDYDELDLEQLETFLNSAWLILRRRRFVQELREAKEAAEAANKAKNAFLATVSHELRTPLNGVLSMLQLIDTRPLEAEQHGYLQTAQASGQALLRIISDLLDYSSMEAGKLRLALGEFDPGASLRSTLELFSEDANRKGLEYSYEIDPALPTLLLGDEARLRQILYNIVGNALKFTAKGSVRVSISALPGKKPGTAGLGLRVEDTGIGIPADKLNVIFEPFVQVDDSAGREYPGTGLGLSIVRRLAGLMNGSAGAESELGKGATVSSTLFFALPPESRRGAPPAASAQASLSGEPLDILVAEDDSVGRMAIMAFLRKRGHRVLVAENGGEALEALQLYDFDCVFTDISMPGIDGLELLRRIRNGDPEGFAPSERMRRKVRETYGAIKEGSVNPLLTVIAVSAHAMIGDKDRFLKRGMDYYISKPIDRMELDGALDYARRAKNAGRPASAQQGG